jgi:hypothetical protein
MDIGVFLIQQGQKQGEPDKACTKACTLRRAPQTGLSTFGKFRRTAAIGTRWHTPLAHNLRETAP